MKPTEVETTSAEVSRLLSLVPAKHPNACNADELAAFAALVDGLKRHRAAVRAAKAARKAERYFSHTHNMEGGLRNGSFTVIRKNGDIWQYMNGDNMGKVAAVPASQSEIDTATALRYLPPCCGGKGRAL